MQSTKTKKISALKLLIKSAVREALQEELSDVLVEVVKSIKPLLSENSNAISSKTIAPKPIKSVKDRVFFDQSTPPNININEAVATAAENIKKGNYNLNDLAAMASTGTETNNPDFKDISESDVNNFMAKYLATE